MESNEQEDQVREQLDAIEHGELASWVVLPPTPAWWAPGFGLWASALTLAIGRLDGVGQTLAELGLVAVMLLAIGWDRRRRGTYPSGRPPRDFSRAMIGLLVGAASTALAAWAVGALLSVWAAAVLAGVGSWVVVSWYERTYAAVAKQIRARLT